jgi:hypothetical protein
MKRSFDVLPLWNVVLAFNPINGNLTKLLLKPRTWLERSGRNELAIYAPAIATPSDTICIWQPVPLGHLCPLRNPDCALLSEQM